MTGLIGFSSGYYAMLDCDGQWWAGRRRQQREDGGLGANAGGRAMNRRNNPMQLWRSPRCGARTRSGRSCQSPAVRGKRRCRMHGGKSTGPKKGSQNALKHKRYIAAAILCGAERRSCPRTARHARTGHFTGCNACARLKTFMSSRRSLQR